ncbi:MAG: hypothetical protein RJA35_503 [Actinomycetota bacterium]
MIRQIYAGAGLGHIPASKITLAIAVGLAALALSLAKLTGIAGVGLAGLVLGAAATLELLRILASQRERALVQGLPELIEALAAGISSGQELGDAMIQQATHGPKALRKSFGEMAQLLQKGTSLEQALGWLQVELSNVYADQLVQLLQVSLRSGGAGLVANLEHLSEIIRVQGSLEEELAAKQGWVTGTAKLGLVAPWLIVIFLNARTEAHAFYASAAGFALLSVGLIICLLAYLLIVAAGRLPKAKRVFIDVA